MTVGGTCNTPAATFPLFEEIELLLFKVSALHFPHQWISVLGLVVIQLYHTLGDWVSGFPHTQQYLLFHVMTMVHLGLIKWNKPWLENWPWPSDVLHLYLSFIMLHWFSDVLRECCNLLLHIMAVLCLSIEHFYYVFMLCAQMKIYHTYLLVICIYKLAAITLFGVRILRLLRKGIP